ncbi:MAG TPA: hypothetical protein VGM84_26310 [Steroidobacteraceae bacterium]|jgi:hypothetical protein
MAKEFRAPTAQDFEIIEDGEVVGHVRVKPSGVSWARKGSHSWFRVPIEEFADYAENNGSKSKK